jgi:hypothetical protein
VKVADAILSGMSERELNVVAGALARAAKPKAAQLQDALAKRWRAPSIESDPNPSRQDVIPLLAGWIRRLEREAGAKEPTEQAR